MTIISLIAAMDLQHGIGKNNQLLCHLPRDLKHFKEITLGKPIIMGRKTYESIGRPLPLRENIVISRQQPQREGITVVDSLDKALMIVNKSPEVFIIGGASIYEQALSLASQLYLTIIHHEFNATVFFPIIADDAWKCLSEITFPADDRNPFAMTFKHFQRVN